MKSARSNLLIAGFLCALAQVHTSWSTSSLFLPVECKQQQPLNTTSATTITAKQLNSKLDSSNGQHDPQVTIFKQLSDYLKSPLGQDEQIGTSISDATSDSDSLSSLMLKTYIRTSNMRAYHLDLHSYRPKSKFIGDPAFVSSLNLDHRARCSRHLSQYEQALKSFKEFDPILDRNLIDYLKLADAFGRPEAGVLLGNQYWLGSYDNCLKIKLNNPYVGSDGMDMIQSQYCLGVAQFPNWNPQDGKTSIKIGLCLPETCTSSMLSDEPEMLERVERMMKMSFGSGLPYDRMKLRHVFCLPHRTSQVRKFSTSALYFLGLVGTLVTLCLVSTVVDHYNRKQQAEAVAAATAAITTGNSVEIAPQSRTWKLIVVESFSITRNLEKFMTIPASSLNTSEVIIDENNIMGTFDRNRLLNSINGLKCIGLMWIICAHTFLVAPIPEKNLIDMDTNTKTYLASIYQTAHLMVDTFFALSGLLASYFIFREGLDKIKTSSWIVLTIHRYWRLTPIYILCYWFTKSIGHLVNEGPLWDYATSETSPRLNCERESWSQALLHLSDFKSPKDHCVPFAWFIANGIKFWMVTPFFLIAIHKSIRRGYRMTLYAIAANILIVGYLAYNSNVDVKSVIEFKPESADNMLNEMGQVYTRPYSRIGAYLVGLLTGHLIYLVDSNQLEIKISKNAKIIAWTLFSVTVLALSFILKLASGVQLDDQGMRWVFSISSAIIRPIWALATCWLVLTLAHGQVRWLSNFLSANIWKILVKLSFCAYLVQGEVLAQIYFAKTNSETFNYVDLITRPIVTIVMTVIVSFLMVILFEFPLIGIEELILPKRQKSSSSVKESDCQQQVSCLKVPSSKLKST